MRLILDYAVKRGVKVVWGAVLRENTAMIKLLRSLGFSIGPDEDPALIHAEIRLGVEGR
jgi:acetyltransferase